MFGAESVDEIRILLSQIVTQTTPNAGEKFNSKIIALERAVPHLLVVSGEGGGEEVVLWPQTAWLGMQLICRPNCA